MDRLSKLQKWILNRCLENKEDGILREGIREFFGKKLPPKRRFSEAMNEDIYLERRERNLSGKEGFILPGRNLFLPSPLRRLFQEA